MLLIGYTFFVSQATHDRIPGAHTLPHAQEANCIWAAARGPSNEDGAWRAGGGGTVKRLSYRKAKK